MDTDRPPGKTLRHVAVFLFLMAAVLVALVIVPPVSTDGRPGARPDRAAAAFQLNALLNLAAAVVCGLIAVSTNGGRVAASAMVTVGLVGLVLALALVDAAAAFRTHGPPLATATSIMRLCAVADGLAGVLLITAAWRSRHPALEHPHTAR